MSSLFQDSFNFVEELRRQTLFSLIDSRFYFECQLGNFPSENLAYFVFLDGGSTIVVLKIPDITYQTITSELEALDLRMYTGERWKDLRQESSAN